MRKFLDWARENCLPISDSLNERDADLLAMIGDAQVVSLREGLHGAREPIEFRNKLFTWLVERLQFRAIALESGMSSGRLVDAFVQGEEGAARQGHGHRR